MKKFLICSLLGMVLLLDCTAQQGKPLIRFGLLSDIQYADSDTKGSRFYRNSLSKLESCVGDINSKDVEFTINMGDVIDRDQKDLDTVLHILDKLEQPLYNTPGNHDYSGLKDNRLLYEKLKMPGEYYSFKRGNWKFVLLNTNEVASYSNVEGTWKEPELKSMFEKIKKEGGHNAAAYNGGISSKQVQWLKEELEASQEKGEYVLIFSHHPMGCADGLTALNKKEIVATVSKFSCVKALIAGHHHEGAYCLIAGIPCIVLEGMVETADQNAYATVELYPGKMVLNGYGRVHSRVINVKGN